MAMLIRKATQRDGSLLAELLLDLGLFETLSKEPVETVRQRVGARLAQGLADGSHSIYVAEAAATRIVGYGSVHWLPYLFMNGPEGYVSELFVRASARGPGVGKDLLAAILAEARIRGCYRLSLINLRNRELYRREFYVKAGWEERREAANFIYRVE